MILSSKPFKDKNFLAILVICIILLVLAVLQWPVDYMLSIYFLVAIVILILIYCCIMKRDSEASPKPTPRPEPVADVPAEDEPEDDSSEMYIPEVEVPEADLSDLPIETIEGIGRVYGTELRNAGINTVLDLLSADPQEVANVCHVPLEQAKRWKTMSRFAWLDVISEEDAEALVIVGFTSLKELANADPHDLLKKVEAGVADGRIRIPDDYEFTLYMVTAWIDSAKEHL